MFTSLTPKGKLLRNSKRYIHSVKTSNISSVPDFTKYSPTRPINEELTPYIYETLQGYRSESRYVNPQHYYHNDTVLIKDYLQKSPHAVSLTQLAQYYDDSTTLTKHKIINSGRFVKEELAIRMAHKIHKLQKLPFNVVNNFHLAQVYESYYNIFERFRKYPRIKTIDDNYKFCEFIKRILQDFNSLNLPHLVMGALECNVLDLLPREEIDSLLSSLLRARISRRLIVEEHLSITANYLSGKKENTLVLGDIFQECVAMDYLIRASKISEKFVQDMYFDSIPLPKLIVEGDTKLKFYFLPTHLEYILGEILRNIYEATIKDYIRKGIDKPEPIVVTIVKTEDSFLFRFADKAGGILHHDENIWSFGKSKERSIESLENFHKLPGLQTVAIYDHLYQSSSSSSPSSLKAFKVDGNDQMTRTNAANRPYLHTSLEAMGHPNLTKGAYKFEMPLIEMLERAPRYKLGIGLAMCKTYAEYWNGDLTLNSIPGYGTDTTLKLGNLMAHTNKLQLDKV
ncbi:protein kinase PKP2 NDAI_0I01660 [Naumovozyma dairenensis CBS 421]|uniref:Protein-serine/threonine kinase n=1 Tax=Naumovozyma dairenensis (strain ATCC 10597 / BCRC 20456 / CBS 421 / NBRC 0211 / NRRL Y-12639) TaxID=1071378 RepID=G0WG24_NAUDC|nr:hypothetical protein NDAI_0I01660 [Naumovozyma dairenensis CBS 421]CCD26735.1 hypothetical protein NDAI_0I01660 [Naumovozyma dairenensis CBS 421]